MAHEHQVGGTTHRAEVAEKRPAEGLRGTEVLEAVVIVTGIAIIIALFLGGVVTGLIVVVALAVRREDRRFSLSGEAPDRISSSTRRLIGVGRRDLDAKLFRSRQLVH